MHPSVVDEFQRSSIWVVSFALLVEPSFFRGIPLFCADSSGGIMPKLNPRSCLFHRFKKNS